MKLFELEIEWIAKTMIKAGRSEAAGLKRKSFCRMKCLKLKRDNGKRLKREAGTKAQ